MSDDRREPAGDPRDEPTAPADAAGSDRDATRRLPDAAGPAPTTPAGTGAWSGRAGVPPPRPSAAGTGEPAGWGEYGPGGGRPWWTPILIGLLALLLLGGLALVFWLVSESTDPDGPSEPSPSATPAAPTRTHPPTPTATTDRPTPDRTSAAPIPVPPLVGLPLSEARDLLDELGLKSRLEYRPSTRPADTVIDTDPGAGTLATPGDTVTLVIAQPRPSPPGPPTATVPGPTTSPGA